MSKIFSELNVLVTPSLIENYPLVIREALSVGIPVVASKVGGVPEIIEEGINGLLFNPNNKIELINIIKKLNNDNKILKKLKRGIKPVKTMDEEAEELINSYKNIFNETPNVSIIIPVFNKIEYTIKCLESIYLNTPDQLNFEVIVVDNASTDDTREFLNAQQKIYKNLKVIVNNENLGFAKANNLAASQALGPNLVFLNNDTEVQNGWLEALLKVQENDDKVGAVGSKLLYPDRTIQHAGVIIIDNKEHEYPLVASNVFTNEPADLPQANEMRTYQALTAACLLVKKQTFFQAGGFDDGFWNGYEDVDLCLKLGELGYKLIYQPESVVIHHESKSGQERFSKVNENIKLLNEKWKNKVEADFFVDENKNLIQTKAGKIKKYFSNNISSEKEKVSIITLTYNQLDYTKAFINSVFQFTSVPFELIIVDNASSDGTVKYLKDLEKSDSRVKVIFNKENLGFPKGVNQSLTQTLSKGEGLRSKYILIANNDIIVNEGWLERMIQVAESNSQIGLVGPISNAVSGVQIDKEAKYNSIEEMHKYAASVRQKNKNQFSEFPRIAFLCTLIKKEVVKKIGGLDERFSPGNFEDDDFCLRAQLAGYKTVIAKDVFIHHFGSKSFTADGMKKYEERLEINKKIFIEKWGADPEEIWLHGKKIKERNIMYSIKQDDFIENFEQALSHLNQKEYELAFNSMVVSINNFDHEKAKIFNTDLHSVLNLAGNIGLLINKTEVARSYFEKALNNNPKSAEACNGLAEIFLLEENYEAANIMFGYAYNFDPNNKNALQGLEKVNALLSNSIKNENMNNNPDNNQLKIITKRNDLGSLLNSLNLKGHGAEIGVQQGEFSKIIRATWKGKYLHLIDRWRSDDDYKDIANVSDETHKQFYFKVLNLFADDQGVFVYKMDSIFAAQQFPDNYFDWIYLDADHSYDGCKKDLNVWYPKLKPGGIFAGHDFLNGNIPAGEFGVKAAVEEFIQDKEVQLSVTSEDLWKSWYLIKPGAQQYVWTKQTSEDEVINHQKSFENSNTTDKEVIKENIESDGLVSEAYELFNENKFDESLEKLISC